MRRSTPKWDTARSCRRATQFLVGLSTFLVDKLFLILAALILIVVGGGYLLRQPGQRRKLDAAILNLPYVGTLLRRFATAQICRTISTLLSGGIPLINAVEIAAKAISNRAIAADLMDVVQQIREGGSLAASLAKNHTFPDVAIEMVEVGESTGALAEMLTSVSDFYDDENKTSLERFGNLVQPAMLVVMGFIIAGLLLALYMPLFNLGSVMSS